MLETKLECDEQKSKSENVLAGVGGRESFGLFQEAPIKTGIVRTTRIRSAN